MHRKAHQALLRSRTQIEETEKNLISLSYQILRLFSSRLMKKIFVLQNGWGKNLKDCVVLDEIVMKWIQQSKKDKSSFFMS